MCSHLALIRHHETVIYRCLSSKVSLKNVLDVNKRIRKHQIESSRDPFNENNLCQKINKNEKLENTYTPWKCLDDITLKSVVLIKQGELALKYHRFFPRYEKLLQTYLPYLRTHFPNTSEQENASNSRVLSSLDNFTSELNPLSELSEVLSKIYSTNSKLAGFVDACVASSEVGPLIRILDALRRESKIVKSFETGSVILDPTIHETLARHFAINADWINLEHLFNHLRQDGLPISRNMYFYGLECLGALLKKVYSSKSRSISKLASDTTNPSRLGTKSTIVVEQIKFLTNDLIDKAEKEGYDLKQGLLEIPHIESTLQNVLTALFHARPTLVPNLSYFVQLSETNPCSKPIISETSYPAQKHVDQVQHKLRNPFANIFPNHDALMATFNAQLAMEQKVNVPIPPVLNPFIVSDNPLCGSKPVTNPELKKMLKNALLKEQMRWRPILLAGFKELLQRLKLNHSRGKITVYPFLKILPASQFVDLMIKAIDEIAMDTALQHISSTSVFIQLGERVESACTIYRKEKLGVFNQLKGLYSNYGQLFNETQMEFPHFRHMWLYTCQANVGKGPSVNQNWPPWSSSVHYMIGRELYTLIYNRVTFNRLGANWVRQDFVQNHWTTPTTDTISAGSTTTKPVNSNRRREEAPVLFDVITEYPNEMRKEVKIHPSLAAWYRDSEYPPLTFHPTELPMICPPIPWIDLKDAGYLMSQSYATRLMRPSTENPSHDTALMDELDFEAHKIPAVLDALNCLASCPWRVNETILDYLINVARSGGNAKLSIPEWKNRKLPQALSIKREMTTSERRAAYREVFQARKEYDEARSLWATELYRLSIANQYRGKPIWFPHSMDFRGRVYPCPPHFHHMGSDIARSLIYFAKGLPLGPKGLDWLKIHLINLTGLKKRSSNAERLDFANSLINEILDSADNPFNGRGWWREQEEPWQTLACCIEIRNALRCPTGPERFVSHFPVHQDGSCNGLQHYAALGRDRRGAESVNLTNTEHPQDVYSDVVEVVEAQRKADAAAGLPVAQVLEGYVRRKVIKQSVMTTVYGVTLYGASEQIRKQLRDLDDFPYTQWAGQASSYLARLTLTSIGKIFTSSTEIQNWFGQIAHHVSRQIGARVSWETPLGLPVVQPYMRLPDEPRVSLTSTNQNALLSTLSDNPLSTNKSNKHQRTFSLPIPNPVKQCNAFPPNFIHSLDSCHMMLTALHCFKENITFASVHDCFWTHAATVDQMNRICREEFIALHSEPILERFAEYLRDKFGYSDQEIAQMSCETRRAKALAFNELLARVPKQGSFELSEVKNSTYFFS